MALTLIEAAKKIGASGDAFSAAVVQIFAQSAEILRVLPFTAIAGNALRYNREAVLPGIGFRGVNEAYPESTGVINPITEPLVIAGGDLDVDKFIIQTMGESHKAAQVQMKIKALAHAWSEQFIKGDSESDPRTFDGLQKRLVGDQLIDAGSASGGDALSLSKLDELIDAVSAPMFLFMSKAMRRHLTVAARDTSVGGQIDYTTDEFGRKITQYAGLPILLSDDLKAANPTLGFTEANPGGGSNVGTSIYCLNFGETTLTGIQNGDIRATDLGELDEKPVERVRTEWYAGIAMFDPFAAARLRGIKDAAVVA